MKDTIYREAAIEAIKGNSYDNDDYIEINGYGAINDISALPSADRPQGEWEIAGKQFKYIRCPYCKTARASSRSRFCDWCGARLKSFEDTHLKAEIDNALKGANDE